MLSDELNELFRWPLFPILSDELRVATRWGFQHQPDMIHMYIYIFRVDFPASHMLPRVASRILSSSIMIWVVVSNVFYFHPYLGKITILTDIFQMGWNHQPVMIWIYKHYSYSIQPTWCCVTPPVHSLLVGCWAVGPLRRVDDRKAYGYPVAYQEGGAKMNRLR